MIRKSQVIFFYANDAKLDELLNSFPYYAHNHISKLGNGEVVREYDHCTLRCLKRRYEDMGETIGVRATELIIEKALFEQLDSEVVKCCLQPMLCSSRFFRSKRITIF